MKPIHTNAVLDNVCTFLLHLSGLLLLYSIMVSSWGFSHSYAVKIFTAILHLIHLWSTQAILRWSIYVSLVDPELGALAFKATMVLRKVLLVILSCLVIQAYVRGLPFFVALAILVSYLVADMALIWMHRPAIADRRPPRHFLIYDPDTHGFFLGRDENVSGVEQCRHVRHGREWWPR